MFAHIIHSSCNVVKLDNVKEEDVASLAMELQGLLIEAGFPHILTFENRFQAILALCLHSAIRLRKAELDQFISGLGPLINIVRKYPDLAVPLFMAGHARPPTAEQVFSLVKYEDVDDKHKEFSRNMQEKIPSGLVSPLHKYYT